jgi:hypothetical protein
MEDSRHRRKWVATVDAWIHLVFLVVAAVAIWQSSFGGHTNINSLLFP